MDGRERGVRAGAGRAKRRGHATGIASHASRGPRLIRHRPAAAQKGLRPAAGTTAVASVTDGRGGYARRTVRRRAVCTHAECISLDHTRHAHGTAKLDLCQQGNYAINVQAGHHLGAPERCNGVINAHTLVGAYCTHQAAPAQPHAGGRGTADGERRHQRSHARVPALTHAPCHRRVREPTSPHQVQRVASESHQTDQKHTYGCQRTRKVGSKRCPAPRRCEYMHAGQTHAGASPRRSHGWRWGR